MAKADREGAAATPPGSSGATDRGVAAWLSEPRASFREWREPRPVLGASLLVAGGLAIGYVPIQFASELLLIGGTFTFVGLVFAVLVAFCGIAALARPRFSSVFGVLGAAFATLSLFGALGGLFVGTVVGTAGGVLSYAWTPPAGYEYEEPTLSDASEFIWQETGGFVWQRSGGFVWQTDDDGSDDLLADADAEDERFSFRDRFEL